MRLTTKSALLKRIAKPLAAVATTAALAGFGLGLDATAASAATTPYWGMDCYTSTSGSFGGYYGNATCTGTGIWQVQVSCLFGGNPTSLIMINTPGLTQSASAGSCYWGINSVTVKEYTRTP
ncbi:MAG: hypothetical protein QOJ50_1951 [Cryptosporangiaceae bacterium]|nr:hypothetical protein [Cryptosporangiaceae bacterium]